MLDCMYDKANRKLYMLKRIRPLITNSVAALVYKTHILPILDYGDFLVDSGKLSKIDRLNNLHKRAVKLIDNKAHRVLRVCSVLFDYRVGTSRSRHCTIDEHLWTGKFIEKERKTSSLAHV